MKSSHPLFAIPRFVFSDARFSRADRLEFSMYHAFIGIWLLQTWVMIARMIWWMKPPFELYLWPWLAGPIWMWGRRINQRFNSAYWESLGTTSEAVGAMVFAVTKHQMQSWGRQAAISEGLVLASYVFGAILVHNSGVGRDAWFLPLTFFWGLITLLVCIEIAHYTWRPMPPDCGAPSWMWPSRWGSSLGTGCVWFVLFTIVMLMGLRG